MKRLRQYWWQRENKKSLRSLTVSCHLRRQKFCLRKPTEAPFPYYHFSVWQKIFERKHTNYMNSIKIKFLKTKLSSSSVELHSQHRRIMLSHSWIWNIQSTECQIGWTIKRLRKRIFNIRNVVAFHFRTQGITSPEHNSITIQRQVPLHAHPRHEINRNAVKFSSWLFPPVHIVCYTSPTPYSSFLVCTCNKKHLQNNAQNLI